MSEEITETELKGKVDNLSLHEQALYAFFIGDYREATRLFGQEDIEENPETAFLLGLCYSKFALNQPAKMKSFLGFVISEHEDSLFAKPAADIIQRSETTSR